MGNFFIIKKVWHHFLCKKIKMKTCINFSNSCTEICSKLVSNHPWVLGNPSDWKPQKFPKGGQSRKRPMLIPEWRLYVTHSFNFEVIILLFWWPYAYACQESFLCTSVLQKKHEAWEVCIRVNNYGHNKHFLHFCLTKRCCHHNAKQQLACILRIYTKPAIKKDTDSVQCCLVAPMPKPMEVKSKSTRSTLNMCECEWKMEELRKPPGQS